MPVVEQCQAIGFAEWVPEPESRAPVAREQRHDSWVDLSEVVSLNSVEA